MLTEYKLIGGQVAGNMFDIYTSYFKTIIVYLNCSFF